ncbi:nucleotide glucose-1-phosphate uridylyl transferase [Candidatus Marinamargulisbacteria bacterium SCGC AAA071-K20]|nr:nucleotide glucose-1-phosphate uridylyl transferase [Candidatus Marinamargulisbacteria bacterium SCGC AAA071-K20]
MSKNMDEIIKLCSIHVNLSESCKQSLKRVLQSATESQFKLVFSRLENTLQKFMSKLVVKPISEAQKFTFIRLYINYLVDPIRKLSWKAIEAPNKDSLLFLESLPNEIKQIGQDNLNKVAILKVNGGLGTSMGCNGPKAMITVAGSKNFLDITFSQIQAVNSTFNCKIPLILMNSFNTSGETSEWVACQNSTDIYTYEQEVFPRIDKNSGLPFETSEEESEWNPPGHGSVYQALYDSGLLDKLIESGKEIIFISNVDNLGAVVDRSLLGVMISDKKDFLIETAPKTKMDVKGGTIVTNNGRLTLLERAQVPDAHINEFEDINKFTIFNTNSLWINLKALKKSLEKSPMELPLIVNPKTVDNKSIIQLETAMGAAIENFKNVGVIVVGRDRFLPVKKTNDLLLLQSSLFSLDSLNIPRLDPSRTAVPMVSLDDHYKTVHDFNTRFKAIPNMLDCNSLSIEGDVRFEENVTLVGDVKIINTDSSPLIIKNETLKGTS